MMRVRNLLVSVVCILFTVSIVQDVFGQEKRLLTSDDVKSWERLGAYSLSKNGEWLEFTVATGDGNRALHLKNTKTKFEKVIKNSYSGKFSSDNSWFAYAVGVSVEEDEKLKKEQKKPEVVQVLYNLNTKDSIRYNKVTSLNFSANGKYIALLLEKDKDDRSQTSQLVVRELHSGAEFYFGGVSQFAWSDEGNKLAIIVSNTSKIGNGVQCFDPSIRKLDVLISENEDFTELVWRKKSSDLAVRKKIVDNSFTGDTYQIIVWKNVGLNEQKKLVFDQKKVSAFPVSYRIATSTPLTWSKNGDYLFFDIFPWEKKVDSTRISKKPHFPYKEAPEVQVWHSKDVMLLTEQQETSEKSTTQPRLSAWNITENTFSQLEDEGVENVVLNTEVSVFHGLDETPYLSNSMFGRGNQDLYRVDVTGRKQLVEKKVSRAYGVSPNSKYLLYIKDHSYVVYDLSTNQKHVVKLPSEEKFFDDEDDHPTHEKGPYGFAGWLSDSKACLINGKNNVWKIGMSDYSAVSLTSDVSGSYEYRVQRMDYTKMYLDASEPLLFTIFGIKNKKTGYARVLPGKKVEVLILEEGGVNGIKKADNQDVVVYVKQRADVSPNIYCRLNWTAKEEKLTNTNVNQSNFYWTTAKLVEYTNYAGKKMQGILYYPAKFESGKKYPMITYIYEQLSDGYNYYTQPLLEDYYNTNLFTQNGYFVLKPDIDFAAGDPGMSSVKSLEAVVKEMVKTEQVDENKVGLVGHSWGGYQAAYVPTQTNIFAASIAGAGLTNLISMYGAITPAFGGAPENNHFEVGQERMSATPWDAKDAYVSNSPVMNVNKLNTPMLFEVGDNDTNVNYRQGIEYYNAARRAGKQFVLIVYAKEGHGLREKKNSIDYHNKIMDWFGFYLKGEQAADWINASISLTEQERRLKEWKVEEQGSSKKQSSQK